MARTAIQVQDRAGHTKISPVFLMTSPTLTDATVSDRTAGIDRLAVLELAVFDVSLGISAGILSRILPHLVTWGSDI